MKYFFDTEFYEDGKTIDLISIGIVAENGRELYCVSKEAALDKCDAWVLENVVAQLPPRENAAWKTRTEIKEEILKFVGDDNNPEFWAYYADYDWVAFCQLFGRMIDLPEHFPKFCKDIKQMATEFGNPTLPPQKSGEHDALADAKWNVEAYIFLSCNLSLYNPACRSSRVNYNEEDPGYCIECGTPMQLVRPGKSQPNCNYEEINREELSFFAHESLANKQGECFVRANGSACLCKPPGWWWSWRNQVCSGDCWTCDHGGSWHWGKYDAWHEEWRGHGWNPDQVKSE